MHGHTWRRAGWVWGACLVLVWTAAAQLPRVDVAGFATPESVAVGPNGAFYVSNIGGFGVVGDGTIKVIRGDPFAGEVTVADVATGLTDPKGLVFVGEALFVTDVDRLMTVDAAGELSVFVGPDGFPGGAAFLNDVDADADGNLYVSDSVRQLVFKISPEGDAEVFIDLGNLMNGTNGVLVDAAGHLGEPGSLLVVDFRAPGRLVRVSPDGAQVEELASGLQGDGLAFDAEGNLYVSDSARGVLRLEADGTLSPFASGFSQAADFTIDPKTNVMAVANFNGGTVTFIRL